MTTDVSVGTATERTDVLAMLCDVAKSLIIEGPVEVGSLTTCNPPPTGADDDRLVLAKSMADFVDAAERDGWDIGGSFIDSNDFTSLTKGSVNLIVTEQPLFYRLFSAATHVAKQLNLLKKADRIMLFQAVLYGNTFYR